MAYSFFSTVLILSSINKAMMGIINGPISTSVPLGTNATFTCRVDSADRIFVSWIVEFLNSDYVFDTISPSDSTGLEDSGIFSATSETGVLLLTVMGSLKNNNTIVACKDFSPFASSFSDPASLIVIGPPLAPEPTLTPNSNRENISISWDEPFYWPEHEILGYIIKENISNNVRVFNTSNRLISYSSSSAGPGGDSRFLHMCRNITLMVSAFSDIGESESASLTTYIPKVLGDFRNTSYEIEDMSRGDTGVKFTIDPPPVCKQQVALLSLEIRPEENRDDVIVVKTLAYSGDIHRVTIDVPTCLLKINIKYIVNITATYADEVSKTSIIFNLDSMPTQITAASSSSVLSPLVLAIIAILSVLLTIALIILTIGTAFFYISRRRKEIGSNRSDRNTILITSHKSSLNTPGNDAIPGDE